MKKISSEYIPLKDKQLFTFKSDSLHTKLIIKIENKNDLFTFFHKNVFLCLQCLQ